MIRASDTFSVRASATLQRREEEPIAFRLRRSSEKLDESQDLLFPWRVRTLRLAVVSDRHLLIFLISGPCLAWNYQDYRPQRRQKDHILPTVHWPEFSQRTTTCELAVLTVSV